MRTARAAIGGTVTRDDGPGHPPTTVIDEGFDRVLPVVTARNRHFWEGGADGRLRVLRCGDCGRHVHPPRPVCPRCRSFAVRPEAVGGRGRVHSFTVNHYAWVPGMEPPYVVAEVDLDDAEGVRLITNVVGCAPDDVAIGMAVEVTFARHGSVYVPLFRPVVDA
jgi:uncharacterized protein